MSSNKDKERKEMGTKLTDAVSTLEGSESAEALKNGTRRIAEALAEIPQRLSEEEAAAVSALAFRVWNVAVRLSKSTAVPADCLGALAGVRAVACDILSLTIAGSVSSVSASESSRVGLAKLLARTGKAWDEAGNRRMAEDSFASAVTCLEKVPPETQGRNAALATAFVLMAQSAWQNGEKEAAFGFAGRAKSALSAVDSGSGSGAANGKESDSASEERCALSSLCFNIGKRLFDGKDYSGAQQWLQDTVEMEERYRGDRGGNEKLFVKALLMLANCLLETGQVDGALAAHSSLADSGDSSPATLLLLFRIQVARGRAEDARSAAAKLVGHAELTASTAIEACTAAETSGMATIAEMMFAELERRFAPDPSQYGAVVVRHAELLVSRALAESDSDSVDDSRAMAAVEEMVSRRQLLPPDSAKELRTVVWNAAATSFQRGDNRAALRWLQRVQPLFDVVTDAAGLAKCLRVSAHCHLVVGDPGSAAASAARALEIEPPSLSGLCTSLRAHVALGDSAAATRDVKSMASVASSMPDGDAVPFLELSAQSAFESGMTEVAVCALESVLSASSGDGLAIPLRVLVKLVLAGKERRCGGSATYGVGAALPATSSDSGPGIDRVSPSELSRCCAYIGVAVDRLRTVGAARFFGVTSSAATATSSDEASWFLAVCWNMGLDAAAQHEFSVARQLFVLAHTFASHCAPTPVSNETRRMCLILAASATVEAADRCPASEVSQLANDALSLVDRAKASPEQSVPLPPAVDKSAPYLALVRFRALVLLGDARAISSAADDAAKNVPGVTAGVLEAMADACTKVAPSVSSDLLKRCFGMLLAAASSPADKTSRVLRKLIAAQPTKDLALPHFETAVKLLSGGMPASTWPPQENEWLVATAWNNGVFYFRTMDWVRAERWMTLSLNMSKLCCTSAPKLPCPDAMAAYERVLQKLGKQAPES